MVDLARDVFGRGDSFVQKITGSPTVDRPLQSIREFRNRPNPGIAFTVDMLTTGVDIPDLEFIVFLRPVKSRILFEQMLGRGTRKGEKFSDKSHFTVFDCFDGTLFEYFRLATAITAEPPASPPAPSPRSSTTSGATATATTMSVVSSNGCNASIRKWPAMRARISPPSFRRRLGDLRRELPQRLKQDFMAAWRSCVTRVSRIF